MGRKISDDGLGHVVIGTMALVVVVASVLLTPSDSAVSVFGWEIPPICMFKRWTGWDCAGCGLTRSFTYMGNGMFAAAWDRHRLGPLLYLLVALQVPWRLWKLAALARLGRLMTDRDVMALGAGRGRD